jgi:hypothetical protein
MFPMINHRRPGGNLLRPVSSARIRGTHMATAQNALDPGKASRRQAARRQVDADVMTAGESIEYRKPLDFLVVQLPLEGNHEFLTARPAADTAHVSSEFGNDRHRALFTCMPNGVIDCCRADGQKRRQPEEAFAPVASGFRNRQARRHSDAIVVIQIKGGIRTRQFTPEGHLRIAQRFIAGDGIADRIVRPGGTIESPAARSSVLPGHQLGAIPSPSDESLGYYQPSLRDETAGAWTVSRNPVSGSHRTGSSSNCRRSGTGKRNHTCAGSSIFSSDS